MKKLLINAALVLLLIGITCLTSPVSCNNEYNDADEDETFIAMDEAKMQFGRLILKTPAPNCVDLGLKCGFPKICCGGLRCGNDYKCQKQTPCYPKGHGCNLLASYPCCWPNICSGYGGGGRCIPRPGGQSLDED